MTPPAHIAVGVGQERLPPRGQLGAKVNGVIGQRGNLRLDDREEPSLVLPEVPLLSTKGCRTSSETGCVTTHDPALSSTTVPGIVKRPLSFPRLCMYSSAPR